MTDAETNPSILVRTGGFLANLVGMALLGAAAYGLRNGTIGEAAWLVAAVAMTIIRAPHTRRNKANKIVGARKDAVEKALLIFMFLTMAPLPLVQLATRTLSFANYTLPDELMWLGVAVQPPCLWLFWRSHADLGRNWSPALEVREDHGLITGGVYARMRHPMYAAIWTSVLAQPLLIQNWIAGFAVVPIWAALYWTRIPKEEAMMREEFGADYDAYVARSGRVLPKLGSASH